MLGRHCEVAFVRCAAVAGGRQCLPPVDGRAFSKGGRHKAHGEVKLIVFFIFIFIFAQNEVEQGHTRQGLGEQEDPSVCRKKNV